MMKDVHRLEDRVAKLATHFSQAEKDVSDIQTSTGKIISHGNKIEKIEVLDADEAAPAVPKTGLIS
jgi:DNA recombination protein RmuC